MKNIPECFRFGQTNSMTLTLMLAVVLVALPAIGLASSWSLGSEEPQNESQSQEEAEERPACSTDRRIHNRRPILAAQSKAERVPQTQSVCRTMLWQQTKAGHRLANRKLAPLRC